MAVRSPVAPEPSSPGGVADLPVGRTGRPPVDGTARLEEGRNAADPLLRRTRARPDHNRVRDAPSPVSVLGLAPPPPARP